MYRYMYYNFIHHKQDFRTSTLFRGWLGFFFFFFRYIMDVLPFYTTETRLQNQGPVIHRKDYAIH